MARTPREPRDGGFTFVESLIAMALVGFMVAELGLVMTYAARNTNLSQRITRANALAVDAIEKSRNTAYQSLQLGNANLSESCTMSGNVAACTSTLDAVGQPGGTTVFTRVRTVTPQNNSFPPGTTSLALSEKAEVAVAVSFTDSRGTAQMVRVASIVSRR